MKQYLVAAAIGLASAGALAQTQESGLTFSVTSDDGYNPSVPNTASVSTGTDVKLINYGAGEMSRDRSEFDLSGLTQGGDFVVSFTLEATGFANPLYASDPFVVNVFSYLGNNAASITDWAPDSVVGITVLDLNSIPVGAKVSLDVSSLINADIAQGDSSFGLGINPGRVGFYATLGDFTLASTPPVPEPGTYALMLGGLFVLGVGRRYFKRS